MTKGRTPPVLWLLGGVLVVYLGYPVGAFLGRVLTGHQEGWKSQGLWSALRVSAEGATISLIFGALVGIPLAYVLARRRGWLVSAVSVLVQLPLAIPPLISGILLVYIVGPYTFLGQLSGERLTQTMFGVIVAQTFVSTPFLVVVARSAFRSVDPTLADVAATLGHRPLARFLRVEVHAASEGIRAGMVLMWLRAFGEYGTVVVLAYHPYSLPVYVENLFSSAPLSQAEAPTLLAFGVAVIAIAAGRVPLRRRAGRRRRLPTPRAPAFRAGTPVGFDIDARVGTFQLQVAHAEGAHRLAVVGPSGAGKSLTLQTLAGLLGPHAGKVMFGTTDVSASPPERRDLGYVPQGFGLIPGLTVWQQAIFGVHADPGRAAWWLQTLHIEDLRDRLPQELSGGQRQRVSLARALAVDPQVVLLDEPFSALDAPVRADLRRELRRLQREVNLSTVIVTHDPEDAAMLADEIVVLGDGRVLQSGRCRDVYQRPATTEIGRLLGIGNLFAGVAGPPPPGGRRRGALPAVIAGALPAGTPLLWQVPPEALHVSSAPTSARTGGSSADLGPGRVSDVIDLGRTVEIVIVLAGGDELRARTSLLPDLRVGADCHVEAAADAISVWAQTLGPEPTSGHR